MTRGGLGAALLLVAVAAAGVLVSTAGDWVTGVVPRPAPLPADPVAVPAADAAPAVRVLGVLALAAVPALLAVRGRGRVLVGGVLVLAGVAVVASAAGPLLEPSTVAAVPDGADVSVTWRPAAAVLAGLATAAAGGLVAARGRRWPAMGRRYDAPAARRAGGPAEPADDVRTWEALDRGEDPTGA